MKNIMPRNQTKLTLICIALLLILAQAGSIVMPLVLRSQSAKATAETPPANPSLIIKAINPGYTVNNVRDVGELIELQKLSSVTDFSLAGYSLRYVNTSGDGSTLISFSEGSVLVGEFLLLRLARTSELGGGADATYTTTIAMSDVKLELLFENEIVDTVCWSSKPECAKAFTSDKPTTLVRDLATNKFTQQESYTVHFDAESPAARWPSAGANSSSAGASSGGTSATPGKKPENAGVNSSGAGANSSSSGASFASECRGLEFSEILTYYAENQSEQFVELHNTSGETIVSTACKLRYKNKVYIFAATLAPNAYRAFYPAQMSPKFSLTKNPTTTNEIELLDANDAVLDKLIYEHGQKKSTAFAQFFDAAGKEFWQISFAPTPNAENTLQEFRTCEVGKTINPATGNCVKITATTATELGECPAGKYRNPLTGRCKTLETEAAPKPCAAGYERNPETGRCRKVAGQNTGADFALIPETRAETKTFTALGIVLLLVALGVSYIILQFRHDIARTGRKLRQSLHHVREDLLARCRRPHGDK